MRSLRAPEGWREFWALFSTVFHWSRDEIDELDLDDLGEWTKLAKRYGGFQHGRR